MKRAPSIFIIDDDEDYLLVARRALRRSGMDLRLSIAKDGNEALRALDRTTKERRVGRDGVPAVVLLDLNMPVKNGWEVLQEIRASKATRDLPVVVVSSSDRPDDVRRSYELGANSYVVKRFATSDPGDYIVDAVRYWINLNEPPPPRASDAPLDPPTRP